MTSSVSSSMWNILTCSYCGNELEKTNDGAKCSNCGLEYQYTHSGSLDLRLKKHKKYGLEFELGTPLLSDNRFQVEQLMTNTKPEVAFSPESITHTMGF
jgi:hypothetical protein